MSKSVSKIDKLIDERKELLKKKKISKEDMVRDEEIEHCISSECENKELEKLEKVMNEKETNK